MDVEPVLAGRQRAGRYDMMQNVIRETLRRGRHHGEQVLVPTPHPISRCCRSPNTISVGHASGGQAGVNVPLVPLSLCSPLSDLPPPPPVKGISPCDTFPVLV